MHVFIYYSGALSLMIYLRINRVDLATKEFKKLREKDEDATLTQMAQAWLNIALVKIIIDSFNVFIVLRVKKINTTIV